MSFSGGHYSRPRLLDLAPSSVLEHVTEIMRGPIVLEQPAAAGFTHSIASILTAANGRSVFVKAGLCTEDSGRAVEVGAALAEAIGDLGPELLSWCEMDGWAVAVYQRIPGAAVEVWESRDVRELTHLSHRMRERLDPCTISHSVPYAHEFVPLLGTWSALCDTGAADAVTVAHIKDRPLPYGLRPAELADLEADWLTALEAGTALSHGDIRRDNVMREPSGRLHLVDWTHRWTAPGWADWVRLVPDIAADGFAAAEVFQSLAWRDADAHGINVMLSGLAGRCWRDGHLPAVPGLPQLRAMQLLQGEMTLRWLAVRLGR